MSLCYRSLLDPFRIAVTWMAINKEFTWPCLARDVKNFVTSCDVFKLNNKKQPPKAPLVEPEVITERFQKVALDVVGPLPRSKSGYVYILTAMDLASNFPFAFPMKGYTAQETATNFLKIIIDIGVPASILTDQGTNFMSRVMKEMCNLLAISPIRTSP